MSYDGRWAPVPELGGILQSLVSAGRYGEYERTMVEYFTSYREYVRNVRCGCGVVCPRLSPYGAGCAGRLLAGVDGRDVAGCVESVAGVGAGEGGWDGGRSSAVGLGSDASVGSGECSDSGVGDCVVGVVGSDLGNGLNGCGVLRGKNYARNKAARDRKKRFKEAARVGSVRGGCDVVSGGVASGSGSASAPSWRVAAGAFSHKRVTTQEEQDKFAREWYERKSVENKLAIKEAELRLKRYEDDEASGFDVKKVRAWQLGVEDRIRTLSGKSSSRGDSAASSLPCNSLNPPTSMTSVSERERVLEERCAELEAFKKRVEGGNVKGQGARVQLLEGKLKAATGELEDLRAAWERELKMRAGDLKYARERGF